MSRDYDIVIIYTSNIFKKYSLNKIPPHVLHYLAKTYESYLEESLSNKPLNVNFASIGEDRLIYWSFKGTPDECNNSIFLTCDKHEQKDELIISGLKKRDIGAKIIRSTREILATVTRSEFRTKAKVGICSDIDLKNRLEIMAEIIPHLKELTYYNDSVPAKPKRKLLDIRKSFKGLAFQMGQILGLINGIEYFDKTDVAEDYPTLKPFLLMKTVSEDSVSDDFKPPFVMYSNEVEVGSLDQPFFNPDNLKKLQ